MCSPGSRHAGPLAASRPDDKNEDAHRSGRPAFTSEDVEPSLHPVAGRTRLRQYLRGQCAVAIKQARGITEDGSSLAQQRIGHLLRQLLALGLAGDVALVVLQAVIATVIGQWIQRQSQALALGLAEFALGLVLLALGAALGLVEADVFLFALDAELGGILDPPLVFDIIRGTRRVQALSSTSSTLGASQPYVRP